MVAKFPHTGSSSVGTFWLAATTDESFAEAARVSDKRAAGGPSAKASAEIGGLCRIEDDKLELDVAGELTPSMVSLPSGLSIRQPGPARLDVHGSIPIAPWHVSFLDCHTKFRRSNSLAVGDPRGNTQQVLGAEWVVLGAHVGANDRFQGVRMRVSGLEEWAQTPGLEQTIATQKPVGTALSFTAPPKVSAPFELFGERASIEVETVANFDAIDVHGGQIRRWNRIGLSGLSGWTLEEVMITFVAPVRTLMTLLIGSAAKVLSVEVQVKDQWCEVFGRHVDGGVTGSRPTGVPVMLMENSLKLEHVARWIQVTRDLSPVPQVVAAGLSGEFATVDTQALVMATSAESLDRKLRPDVREFEADVVAAALEPLQSVPIDPDLRAKVVNAVRQYMWEPSMPRRLQVLAEDISQAAPDVVGKVNKWKRAVTDMRVKGAHGLAGDRVSLPGARGTGHETTQGPDAEAIELTRLYSLALSVRWALRIRVLQACGVSDEALHSALGSWKEYERDRSRWATSWPEIYTE